MEPLRQVSGNVLLATSLIMLAFRYVMRTGEEQKRLVYRILQWPFVVSALLWCWLSPWHEQSTNPFHIMVFVALGIGMLILIDDLVDRYRERHRPPISNG